MQSLPLLQWYLQKIDWQGNLCWIFTTKPTRDSEQSSGKQQLGGTND